MNMSEIKMGKLPESWGTMKSRTITFGVTEACDLRCKYCYMTGKNNNSRMNFETAKKAVDYLLSEENDYFKDTYSVIWDFIGGEPFLEIELIDKICDYIKLETYKRNHKWFNSYRFSFSTNGLTYDTPKVQDFIKKNKNHVYVGISVDGNKVKHDSQRIKVDGSGSFDDVKKNVPLWLKQFPAALTKATFAHDDLIYLKDSIIALWDMGIKTVAANVVFEDVWHEKDDEIFESQLIDLADYILDNELWNEYSVRFFDVNIGFPILKEDLERNFCGTGNMLSIDHKGDIYPCIRFTPFTLNNTDGYKIGDIYSGINKDLLRPFKNLTARDSSSEECINCDVGSGCPWCTGFNYDDVSGETLFYRATHICKMWKANVRANEYFWEKLSSKLGKENPRNIKRKEIAKIKCEIDKKYIIIMPHDNVEPHCNYKNIKQTKRQMSNELFSKSIKFCSDNDYIPIVLGDMHNADDCIQIGGRNGKESITIHNNKLNITVSDNNILHISRENIKEISCIIFAILKNSDVSRVNIIISDLEKWKESDIYLYDKQLEVMSEKIYEMYLNDNPIEINVLTDIFYCKETKGCGSGIDSFTIAPNGKIYICPAFYYDDESDYIGNLDKGIHINRQNLLKPDGSRICRNCDSYHCRRCLYLNKKLTTEINTPSRIQCIISHTERNISRKLELKLIAAGLIDPINFINKIDFLDPIDKI